MRIKEISSVKRYPSKLVEFKPPPSSQSDGRHREFAQSGYVRLLPEKIACYKGDLMCCATQNSGQRLSPAAAQNLSVTLFHARTSAHIDQSSAPESSPAAPIQTEHPLQCIQNSLQ